VNTYAPTLGDIGEEETETRELEPMPVHEPVKEPSPAPSEPEKIPA
jgi:hypothetical protein